MSNELLTPNFWSISQLFKYRFSVPVYQRPYSWKISEVNSMLDDIWSSYTEFKVLSEEEKQKASLYVGNIILHKKAFELYDIIDGQQRITTFSIFLLALYAKLNELNVDPNNRIIIKIQSALWKLDMNEKPVIEKRVIELGSIDKQIMLDVFNEAYSQPKNLKKFINKYSTQSPFEENVKFNFNRVYDFAREKFNNSNTEVDDLLQFANFILSKVYLIAIINEDSEFKTFSIFESINSKGKKLDDIDLIKTKIFSSLSPDDYSSYLSKWGKLIVETEDNLYDFLKVYIKANIKYYSGNVTYHHFEAMDRDLCSHFNKHTVGEAYKAMIEDMVDKIDCFNAVFNFNKAISICKNKRFKFYYSVYTKINYEHPWPLFFKCFCEYDNGKGALTEEDLIDVIIETIKFSITFLTVCGKDSKDAISMFSLIFDDVYANKKINKDWIIYQINNRMTSAGIRKEDVLSSLESADVYAKNKQLGAAVLSTYESQYEGSNERQISWDEAYSKFSTYGSSYTLDHIMVQTPGIDDPNLKYYKLGNNLKLKNGHDFPADLVHDGMEYDNFKSLILHRAGNLRLKGGDGNSSHGNSSEENFNTFLKLDARNALVCKFFVDKVIEIQTISKEYNPVSHATGKKKMTGNFDFSMLNLDFTGTKPKSITFNGRTKPINSHRDILTSVIEYLFDLNKDKLIQMAKEEWKPRQRVILTFVTNKLTRPYEFIKDAVYVETNLSAKDIMIYSNKLLDEFNVDKSTVSVYIPE